MNPALPFKFAPNRVKRLYLGGSGIDRLRNAASPCDNNFTEDWIASCVRANSSNVPPEHGLSCFFDGLETRPFQDALTKNGAALLGEEHLNAVGQNPGFLSKLLDSAMRLPVQVHPDRACAKRLFNSPIGKTEAWLVFATRKSKGKSPYILLGFNETLNKELFLKESLEGEYREGLSMLHRFEVKPGDVYVVLGRMPHAIGPGVTMVEVMEPSDVTINPERLCCDCELPLERRFAKLKPEDALSVFDFTPRSRAETLTLCAPAPKTIESDAKGELTLRIPRSTYKFFEAQELSFKGSWRMDLQTLRSFRVGIVVAGSVNAGELELRAGDSFFIPYSCENLTLKGNAKMVFLIPPETERAQ